MSIEATRICDGETAARSVTRMRTTGRSRTAHSDRMRQHRMPWNPDAAMNVEWADEQCCRRSAGPAWNVPAAMQPVRRRVGRSTHARNDRRSADRGTHRPRRRRVRRRPSLVRLVVDTGVFSAALSRRRRAEFDRQVTILAGNQFFLAASTVAELRYGRWSQSEVSCAATGSNKPSKPRR